jgi:nucleotide-binding universal stress UspA family protein
MAAHLAAALGNDNEASITIFQADLSTISKERQTELTDRFNRIKAAAELCGARTVLQRMVTGESIAELILQESRRGYDAIFAGAPNLSGRNRLSGDVIREILREASIPVIIARSYGDSVPFERLLVPTTGAPYSRFGLVVAMLYAQSIRTKVSALHVTENPTLIQGIFNPRRTEQAGQEIADEIDSLGKQLNLTVDTQIGSANKPEKAILRTVDAGRHDLLLMGVLYRSVDQRVYFGPKVERILKDARCAVVVVVSPDNK